MGPEAEPVPFTRRFRHFLRRDRFPLSVLVFAAGLAMVVLALGDFTPLNAQPPFPWVNSMTDQSSSGGVNYNLAFAPVGAIVSIIGAYLVGSYLVARRKFEHLMLTKSKAEFLRNLPEVEDLLWDLTPSDEVRYAEKKSALRIRR